MLIVASSSYVQKFTLSAIIHLVHLYWSLALIIWVTILYYDTNKCFVIPKLLSLFSVSFLLSQSWFLLLTGHAHILFPWTCCFNHNERPRGTGWDFSKTLKLDFSLINKRYLSGDQHRCLTPSCLRPLLLFTFALQRHARSIWRFLFCVTEAWLVWLVCFSFHMQCFPCCLLRAPQLWFGLPDENQNEEGLCVTLGFSACYARFWSLLHA